MAYTPGPAPITHRDKNSCQVGAVLPRPLYDRLALACKRRGITKSEFIRRLLEDKFSEPSV